MIWLDFETRSTCDLKSRGVYNYAQDLTTEVLCMSYAVDDGEVQTWTGIEPSRSYQLTEGAPEPVLVALPTFAARAR